MELLHILHNPPNHQQQFSPIKHPGFHLLQSLPEALTSKRNQQIQFAFSHPANLEVKPPSAIQFAPVTKDASVESRKATQLAISAGFAIRFIG